MGTSDASIARASEVPARPAERSATFRASHFFVLASLMAATGAVIMSRQSTPEHLVLISITIASAGLAAAGFYRMMSPLVGDLSRMAGEALSERSRAVLTREKGPGAAGVEGSRVRSLDGEGVAGGLRRDVGAGCGRGRWSLMKQLDEDGSGYRTIIERELSARLAGRAAAGRGRTAA